MQLPVVYTVEIPQGAKSDTIYTPLRAQVLPGLQALPVPTANRPPQKIQETHLAGQEGNGHKDQETL